MSHRDRSNYQRKPQRSDSRRSYSNSRRRPHSRSPRPYIQKGSEVYLLDILQHGGVDQAHHSWDPIAQIIVVPDFELYEVTLNKNKIGELKLEEKYAFDFGKESLFIRVNKLLKQEQLTPASQNSLPQVIRNYVLAHEDRFVKFVNNVGPITIRRHYLEVLPGVGKKLMNEIITQRTHQPFENYEDAHNRVPGFKPIEMISKRIIEELENSEVKHRMFVRKKKPGQDTRSNPRSSSHNRNYSSNRRSYR